MTETLTHEFSASYEWSYASKPCEYCNPRIYFTAARISVFARRAFGLPLFVARRTVFDPGPEYEIRGHCRSNAVECGDCAGAARSSGQGPLARASAEPVGTAVDRVVYDARAPRPAMLDELARAFAPDRDSSTGLSQHRYVVDLENRAVPLKDDSQDIALLCVDDLDRAIGAVRVHPGPNELLLGALASGGASPAGDRLPEVWLDSHGSDLPYRANATETSETSGMRMTRLQLEIAFAPGAAEDLPAMDLHVGQGSVHRVWPMVVLPRDTV